MNSTRKRYVEVLSPRSSQSLPLCISLSSSLHGFWHPYSVLSARLLLILRSYDERLTTPPVSLFSLSTRCQKGKDGRTADRPARVAFLFLDPDPLPSPRHPENRAEQPPSHCPEGIKLDPQPGYTNVSWLHISTREQEHHGSGSSGVFRPGQAQDRQEVSQSHWNGGEEVPICGRLIRARTPRQFLSDVSCDPELTRRPEGALSEGELAERTRIPEPVKSDEAELWEMKSSPPPVGWGQLIRLGKTLNHCCRPT